MTFFSHFSFQDDPKETEAVRTPHDVQEVLDANGAEPGKTALQCPTTLLQTCPGGILAQRLSRGPPGFEHRTRPKTIELPLFLSEKRCGEGS